MIGTVELKVVAYRTKETHRARVINPPCPITSLHFEKTPEYIQVVGSIKNPDGVAINRQLIETPEPHTYRSCFGRVRCRNQNPGHDYGLWLSGELGIHGIPIHVPMVEYPWKVWDIEALEQAVLRPHTASRSQEPENEEALAGPEWTDVGYEEGDIQTLFAEVAALEDEKREDNQIDYFDMIEAMVSGLEVPEDEGEEGVRRVMRAKIEDQEAEHGPPDGDHKIFADNENKEADIEAFFAKIAPLEDEEIDSATMVPRIEVPEDEGEERVHRFMLSKIENQDADEEKEGEALMAIIEAQEHRDGEEEGKVI
ncbi:hypothetical protein M422DRAFT_248624 [Sphaerobolus stellatus SS14]|nr:hypothetical protein M422DRAFT_248624 [Sphaerobolus stellatus SS14]